MVHAPTSQLNLGGRPHSVEFEKLDIPKGRASSGSAQSTSDGYPEFEARQAAIKRRGTHVAVVKLSWWDCFKGMLFGPKTLKRQLAATVEWAEVDDSHAEFFDYRENWYILTVSAYTREGRDFISARCVLDTGCTQGNIISTDLARRLGFNEPDYQALAPRETNGGVVANGEIHKALGAISVSWFSQTSPKVFNKMRFLVSETAPFDLVIGTRSIQKEKLLNPPNFLNTNFIELTSSQDSVMNSLVLKIAKRETAVVKAEIAVENTRENTRERASADKELAKAKNALKVAKWERALYDVNVKLERENNEQTRKALRDTKKGLEAKLESKKGKKEKKDK